MANERKTENIVRKYFAKFENDCLIEEQKSDNPRINKLLKNASKKGSADGKPEFIISFPNKDLLIVIECKADTAKHKSRNLDKYSEYAVDGALLYSSYLSREFDVIAIGVSGENHRELQIDTYLQTQGEKQARDLGIKNYMSTKVTLIF